MSAYILWASALADFRERVRRPAFLIMLLAAMVFTYFVVPPGAAKYSMLSVGGYRGTYDSRYIGTVVALMGSFWLCIMGFFIIKNAVTLDIRTGVGQILAASSLRTAAYTFSKFLSNLMVLAALVGVLALTAPVLQWLRGESSAINLFALWLPFLLFAIPALALAAAIAVVFETVPGLRGGGGNVLWFFLWPFMFIAFQMTADVLGFRAITDAMTADILAQYPGAHDLQVSAGLNIQATPRLRYDWSGLPITGGLIAGRLALLVFAAAFSLLPALWFARFDSTREKRSRAAVPSAAGDAEDAVTTFSESSTQAFGAAARPRTPIVRGNALLELVLGELRILWRGTSRGWRVVALALIAAGALLPLRFNVNAMLLAAWIWPLLVWSRLGAQHQESDIQVLIASGPAPRRRLLAEWIGGVLLTAFVGAGSLVQLAIGADWPGMAAWFAGALFIPALAVALGFIGGNQRWFQLVYLMIWYVIANGEPALDFMGAIRKDGHLAGPSPLGVLLLAGGLVAATLMVHEHRHARR